MRKTRLLLALMLLAPWASVAQVKYICRPVTITTTNAQSSLDPTVYNWQEGNAQQNVELYLPHATSPYTPEVYMQQNNGRLQFSTEFSPHSIIKIQLNYDNAGYNTVFDGTPRYHWGYANPPASFRTIGSHVLKVKYWDHLGTIRYRTFNFEVVPDASEFHHDNATTNDPYYRNKLVLWDTPNSLNSKVILLVEGFDEGNATDAEFYRQSGDQLFTRFLNNNYKLYVLNFAFNAQDMKRNAAALHAAIEYVSGLNSNNNIILAGASMGGIISRYALAKDEEQQNQQGTTNYLPVSHYVSLDAPHQGAVISQELLSYTKQWDDGNYTFNTKAFEQLVRNNKFESSNPPAEPAFYNYLRALNGTGYPTHCLNIGVAFSKPNLSNPNAGSKWLEITSNPLGPSLDDYVNNEEIVPGSYLPQTTGGINDFRAAWSLVNVTTNKLEDPTFIPHFSALDIVNGESPFCLTVFTEDNTEPLYHDMIPPEIIDPLMVILETASNLNDIAANEKYNYAKTTPKHLLTDLSVQGELLINNDEPAGFSTTPTGPNPASNSEYTVSTNRCESVTLTVHNGAKLKVGNLVASETYNPAGHAAGNVYVYYRSNPEPGTENQFHKPLIVVEGIDFEPYNQQNAVNYQMGDFGWCALWGKDMDKYPQLAKMPQLLNDYHANDYDIIMLDFKDGAADIKENALLFQELVRKVNQYKTSDAEANVVIGASMGGIVSRYGLADMEADGKNHYL